MTDSAKLDAFAVEAEHFVQWATGRSHRDPPSAYSALTRITSLFNASLDLAPANLEYGDSNAQPVGAVGEDDLRSVFERAAALPIQYYSEVFDPMAVPGEDSVIGDLQDDIVDIFRDIADGLALYDAGYYDQAAWHWRFCARTHWWEHATSAIRVLSAYLASCESDTDAPST